MCLYHRVGAAQAFFAPAQFFSKNKTGLNASFAHNVHQTSERSPHESRLAYSFQQRLPHRCGSRAPGTGSPRDRKSTRLNSSHVASSYAVVYLTKTTHR